MIRHALIACALLGSVARPAQAATIRAQTLEELTQAAARVVHGVIRTQHVAWDAGHRHLLTYAEVQVVSSLKGPQAAALIVRTEGGELDGIGQRVEGAPAFAAGEEVVLFLEPAPDEAGVYLVSALSAGKVHLERRAGQAVAVRDLGGLGLYRAHRLEPGARQELGPAEALFERIRAAARTPGTAR